MFLLRLSMLVGFMLVLTGCATPAMHHNMSVAPKDIKSVKKNSKFTNNMKIGNIQGGSETHPLWMSKVNAKEFKAALDDSLKNMDLHNSTNARYRINATLEDLKQPFAGFDFTVTCKARYQIYDDKLNKIIYEKSLLTPYTKKMSESLLAVERLKAANEGAVRENIKELMTQLLEL